MRRRAARESISSGSSRDSRVMGMRPLGDRDGLARAGDRGLAAAGDAPPGCVFRAGSGRVRNAFKETEAFGPYQPPVSAESVKQQAAQLQRRRQSCPHGSA